jgi:hypothetical protein
VILGRHRKPPGAEKVPVEALRKVKANMKDTG